MVQSRKDDEGIHYEVSSDEVTKEAARLAAVYPAFAGQSPTHQRLIAQMMFGLRATGTAGLEENDVKMLSSTFTMADNLDLTFGSIALPSVVSGTDTVSDRVPQGKERFDPRKFLQQGGTPAREGWQVVRPKTSRRRDQ